jgi:hypothetical protein
MPKEASHSTFSWAKSRVTVEPTNGGRSEVILTENLGRCPRCHKFLIQEESQDHKCDFRDVELQDAREIILDHITDLGQNKNDDHVSLGWGLDAVLYRFVECKHNPPHATKRKFTGCDTKQGLDSTYLR